MSKLFVTQIPPIKNEMKPLFQHQKSEVLKLIPYTNYNI